MNEYRVAAWILSHPGAEVDVETVEDGTGREHYKVIGVRSEMASVIIEGGRKHAASRHAAMVEFLKEITAALTANN